MRKTSVGTGIAVALSLALAAQAAEPLVKPEDIPGKFTTTLTGTNEYLFRGISQSDDRPAVQGSVEYELPLIEQYGISTYAGAWGSNVDFRDAAVEVDWTGGFRAKLGKASFDAGFIYYWYPGAASDLNYDYHEWQGAVGYDLGFAAAKASVNYSPNFFGDSGDAVYAKLNVDVPVGKYFTLTGYIARQWVEKNDVFLLPDYTEWFAGAAFNLVGFDFKAGWNDTTISQNDCPDLCRGKFLVFVSKTF